VRTTINHALDILETDELISTRQNAVELVRVIRRVQSDYLEIIENALSLLVQDKTPECRSYLNEEREKLESTKERIGTMIFADDRWPDEFHRLAIAYLYTRARLVDEIRMFPDIALELLERLTLDQSLHETITYLENAMTGKKNLFGVLVDQEPFNGSHT
jgi:hypothetical protein